MKPAFSFLLFYIVAVGVKAQSTNITTLFQSDLKKAELFYEHLAYANALDFFERVATKDPNNKKALNRIVECHVRLGNYAEAAEWMEKVLELEDAEPIDHFLYGQILSTMGKYDEATLAFGMYRQLNGGEQRVDSKIAFLNNLNFHLRDSNLYSIRNEWYNSNQSDFSPKYFNNGIVFVSARDRDLFIKRKSMSALNENEALINAFFVNPVFDSSKSVEGQTKLFYHKNLNSSYHDGPVSFFADGKQIAFTRNILRDRVPVKDKQGRINLELYFARLSGENELSGVVPFEYNDSEYTIAHPWVSNDGSELYFSSNMPGGLGGADLYYCKYSNGKWSKPQNVGAPVNTPGDEYYPFLLKDSVLFFASNGHGGFGSLDNFASRKSTTGFSVPGNLGFPVNSPLDDFGLIVDSTGRSGHFASNRPGGRGYDDIYAFSLNALTLVGTVVERNTGKVIPGASIQMVDSAGDTALVAQSDAQGNFYFKLPLNQDFSISASKEGYTSLESVPVSTHRSGILADTLTLRIWENNMHVEGIVYSNENQRVLPGTTVHLENMMSGKTETVMTENDGRYRFLVTPEQRYKVVANKKGFISNGFQLSTQGLYQGRLLNDIVLEEEFLEKFVVLFEFDKKDIQNEFLKDLEKIARDLKRAPQSTLHIAAHADAQGTFQYNQKLSDERARELVKYMLGRGIALNRIQAIGFGEELVLNQCSDGVECPDEDHAKNRRAELKIQQQPPGQ